LQKGQVNAVSTFGTTFLGGGLLDFRFPLKEGKGALKADNVRYQKGGKYEDYLGICDVMNIRRTYHVRRAGRRSKTAEKYKLFSILFPGDSQRNSISVVAIK
jgi:hypothetical protein